MADYGNDDRLSFPGMLDPVLAAAGEDDATLDDAVNAVAEAMADSGTLVLDATGAPARGASDEDAVLNLLDTYVRVLLHLGELEEAAEIGELMERVRALSLRRKRRGFRAA
ncbi:hypothetical protein [Azospirillum halopraeferens]|uniref:hypothetical protein n=1 Tax=Azospirillum halopraeferens TaxID=34010 RepID=UPI00040E4721|nr:hypothetical protein [Azospirillum halopraeferens]